MSKSRILILTLMLCGLSFGGNFVCAASGQTHETPKEHINRLLKEASGMQSVRKQPLGNEPAFDQALRSEYRDLIQANRAHMAALRQIDPHQVGQLGSPHSLVHPASAVSALDQLHAGYALEIEHERKVQHIYARLHHIFETADLPALTRASLLKIFEDTIIAPSLERQRCINAEKSWIDSMDDLYHYASIHIETLQLVESTIMISDPVIQQEFNGKIVSEEIHRRAFIEKKDEYLQLQTRVFRALAIDPTNVGLQ
jgi:hypothetical protein